MEQTFCSICLENRKLLSKLFCGVRETSQEKLSILIPELEWDENYLICNICKYKLDESLKFRRLCLELEEKRQIFHNNLKNIIKENSNIAKEEEEEERKEDEEEIRNFEKENESIEKIEQARAADIIDIDLKPNNLESPLIIEKPSNKQKQNIKIKQNNKKILYREINNYKFSCDYCDINPATVQELIVHCVNIHRIDPNVIKPYKCNICSSQFLWRNNFYEHKRKHLRLQSHTCYICNKVFNKTTHLRRHQLDVHSNTSQSSNNYLNEDFQIEEASTDNIQFCCAHCDETFKTVKDYDNHLKITHLSDEVKELLNEKNITDIEKNDNKYVCSFCGSNFVSLQRLRSHERNHESTKKLYKCDLCQKSFKVRSTYYAHKRDVHTGPSGWKYSCALCEKKFPTKYVMETHVRRHTGDKRFNCNICEKSFISKIELQRHLFNHTKVKPIQCSYCEGQFTQERNYKVHLANQHGLGQQTKKTETKKKLSCHICNKMYKSQMFLERHVNSHMDIKPYSCVICNKKYTGKYSFQEHLRIVHGYIVELKDIHEYKCEPVDEITIE